MQPFRPRPCQAGEDAEADEDGDPEPTLEGVEDSDAHEGYDEGYYGHDYDADGGSEVAVRAYGGEGLSAEDAVEDRVAAEGGRVEDGD